MKIIIEIEVGICCMRSGEDVAEVLTKLAERLAAYDEDGLAKLRGFIGMIRDHDGNDVGFAKVRS